MAKKEVTWASTAKLELIKLWSSTPKGMGIQPTA